MPDATDAELARSFPNPTKQCQHDGLCTCMWSLRFLYAVYRLQSEFRNRVKRRKNMFLAKVVPTTAVAHHESKGRKEDEV